MRRKKKAMARAGVALLLSSSMTMNAFASSVVTAGTVDVETSAGKNETIEVTIKVDKIQNDNGSVTVSTSSNAAKYDKTESGAVVDYSSTSESTTVGETTTGSSSSEYTSVIEGEESIYTATGGTETSVYINPNVNQTVNVPLTGVDNPETEKVENQNTIVGNEEGTIIASSSNAESEGCYEHSTTKVVDQGSITITTESVKLEENVVAGDTSMEHIKSETNPDGSNDLVHASDVAPEQYLPGYEGEVEIPDVVDGYEYVYIGSGNTSKFSPAIVFKTPLTDEQKVEMGAYIKKNSVTYYYVGCLSEEDKANIQRDSNGDYVTDEEGFILDKNGNRILKEELTTIGPDGTTYYLHRFDKTSSGHKVEGWYEDGEWKAELNGEGRYTAVWAGPQQFILVDSKGNTITTYCADFSTPTQDFYGYNVENLEDATYYSDEEAAQIRAIVQNGYWGTVGENTDENGNRVPEYGSLDAMKAALLASGQFKKEEMDSLNDGVALTATQMAIWSCSNKMTGIEFINSHYTNWGTGNVPEEKEDEVKLLFKIYEYLKNLEPVKAENTTADTIINTDHFVDELALSVIEKSENHVNNQDMDDTNDAYVTNISFALVVSPSTERGDDLVVKVIAADGKILAIGRVAGELKDGESQLEKDADGNYSFKDIVLIEGNQTFKLTLEGIQNLEHGVYLYGSEVKEDTSSQTLVGVAEGERAVDVSMEITFNLDVDDEVIATERVWREEEITEKPDKEEDNPPQEEEIAPPNPDEINPSPNPDPIPEEKPERAPVPEDDEEPEVTVEIDEEDVPLAPTPIIEITEEKVPLSSEPDFSVLGEMHIEDNMIPLGSLPATGNHAVLWMLMSFFSGLGLAGVSLIDKIKRKR